MEPASILRAGTAALMAGLAWWGALAAPAAPMLVAASQSEDAVSESIRIVSEADTDRMMRDGAYAGEVLRHIDRLDQLLPPGDGRIALDNLRLYALIGLQRRDDAPAVIDRLLAQRPTSPRAYRGPWIAALVFNDTARALRVAETAAANVPVSGRAGLGEVLGREEILYAFRAFAQAHDNPSRARLAEALTSIGYGADEPQFANMLRRTLLDERLRRGEPARAAEYAAALTDPSTVAGMLVQKRYDALFPAGVDRTARVRQALEITDRATAARLAAAPTDRRRLLDRTQLLRTLGRDAEALALLEPAIRDVRAVAAEEDGMWLVNEAATALMTLGRRDEAVRLMGQMAEMPIEQYGHLISVSINYGELLLEVGRHADALAHARRLDANAANQASEYGRMWIRATIVCALAGLDRAGEATPTLAEMRAHADDNQAALMRAYLCLNDMPAAEALLVGRLQSEDPEDALMALQDYLPPPSTAGPDPLIDRLLALRERPAVRAALDRVGRIVQLPVQRTYWGGV